MKPVGRVLAETVALTAIFGVLMAFAGGVIAIADQPRGASVFSLLGGGLALAFDPVVGAGIAAPAWIVVILAVGLLTYRHSSAVRFAFAMLATTAITVLAFCAALVSAADAGSWAMLLLGMASAVLLAFLVTAAVALALVHFVFFRHRKVVVLTELGDSRSRSGGRQHSR